MQRIKNEKGFTLVEILVVIAIIAILFVVLLPQLNAAWQKSYMTQVRNDFRSFQLASEAYIMDTLGKEMKVEGINKDLDHGVEFDQATMESKHEDPWGSSYVLELENGKIIIQSKGMNGEWGEDDYLLAVYYHQGYVDSCTTGFDTNNISLTSVTLPPNGVCGDDPA